MPVKTYEQGYWEALDKVLSFVNSWDTEGLTKDKMRADLYRNVMEMKP